MSLSALHGSALIISGATRSNLVALPRVIEPLACTRCAMSKRGCLLPSSFAAREAGNSLHNSICNSFRILSDSDVALTYRLSSPVWSSRLTVKPTPSQSNMFVKLFVCHCVFPSFCSAMCGRCFLRCFQTSDRACSEIHLRFLPSIYSASKCSLDFCVGLFDRARDRCAQVVQLYVSSCVHLHLQIRHRAVLKASSSYIVLGLQLFTCGVRAAFCRLPCFQS